MGFAAAPCGLLKDWATLGILWLRLFSQSGKRLNAQGTEGCVTIVKIDHCLGISLYAIALF